MTDRILLIPLDDRPCTSRLPVRLGAVAGRAVLTPPVEWLGNLTRRASREHLISWLVEAAPEAEAPYWAEHGDALVRYSRAVHESRLKDAPEMAAVLQLAETAIPPEILSDFLEGRRRNLAINRLMIEWAAAGLFDLLYLTVDDSAELGLNVLERDELAGLVAARNLDDRVLIYPGADEVACSLLSRVLLDKADFHPAFFPVYAYESGPEAVTLYEGLPLGETVRLHMAAAGVRLAEAPETADCQLFLHSPEHVGGDYWLGLDLPEDPSAVPEWFIQGIATALQMGSPVAVADVAWANAAHPDFIQRLADACEIRQLLAFAGWNTAGNTLGTVLAHAALRLLVLEQGGDLAEQELAQQTALFERFAEDWLYMAVERPAAALRPGPADLDSLAEQVATRTEACYDRYWRGGTVMRVDARGEPHYWRLGAFRRTVPSFPWARLFDVDLVADFDLEEVP